MKNYLPAALLLVLYSATLAGQFRKHDLLIGQGDPTRMATGTFGADPLTDGSLAGIRGSSRAIGSAVHWSVRVQYFVTDRISLGLEEARIDSEIGYGTPEIRYYPVNRAAIRVYGEAGAVLSVGSTDAIYLTGRLGAGIQLPVTENILINPRIGLGDLLEPGGRPNAGVGVALRVNRVGGLRTSDQWRAFRRGVLALGLSNLYFEPGADGFIAAFSPVVHYFVWPRVAVGASLSYRYSKYDRLDLREYDLGPVVQYYFRTGGPRRWFAQAELAYAHRGRRVTSATAGDETTSHGGLAYGGGGGLSLMVGKGVSLDLAAVITRSPLSDENAIEFRAGMRGFLHANPLSPR